MAESHEGRREGSLEAPTRHPIDWTNPSFYDPDALFAELERVFDICHGCRRCFNLCQAFPTLFDAVDASDSGELDGVPRHVYWEVVDHCYLCDMCFMSKCPYVPPHEWNVDFPHLMLRAKAVGFRQGRPRRRDRLLTSTDTVGRFAGIPVVAQTVNASNRSGAGRKLLERTLGVHRDAWLPEYSPRSLRRKLARRRAPELAAQATEHTRGRVVLYTTCYGDRNEPELGDDLVAVFEYNGIAVGAVGRERCCGMPKLELGDLEAVDRARQVNIPALARRVDEGFDIVAPVPSCVLMYKQELPLMYPDDPQVKKVQAATFDPFEYLMLRHREGRLRTDFARSLGRVAYHVACHLRVQNIGLKTRQLLELIPDTEVQPIERCSGHNGIYALKREAREAAVKIRRPVVRRVAEAGADFYCSDCPMAGHHIENGLPTPTAPTHPLKLLRLAYGI